MRASDIREQTQQELEEKLDDVKKSLFNLKFQKAIGQLENTQVIRNLRKDIAKIETVLHEKRFDAGDRTENKKADKKDTGKLEAKKKKSIKKEAAKRKKAPGKGGRSRTGAQDG
jgi:large subunit ribosomal protein L29